MPRRNDLLIHFFFNLELLEIDLLHSMSKALTICLQNCFKFGEEVELKTKKFNKSNQRNFLKTTKIEITL